MQSVLVSFLVAVVKRIVSPTVYQYVQTAVAEVEPTEKTGAEKRSTVYNYLASNDVVSSVAVWLLNLAIETAVTEIKLK